VGSKYKCTIILDPYAIVAYCIFYLTNVDKLSHEKCKCEEIEALK
jgi:hypothetical protein